MSILSNIINSIYNLIHGPISPADLVASLDKRAAANQEKLDWRNSIVDLMKLTGQDSSLESRKQLAKDLGYTGPLDGSAEMNIWLHQRVMDKLR